jgi:hypothetical protein
VVVFGPLRNIHTAPLQPLVNPGAVRIGLLAFRKIIRLIIKQPGSPVAGGVDLPLALSLTAVRCLFSVCGAFSQQNLAVWGKILRQWCLIRASHNTRIHNFHAFRSLL